MEYDFEADDEGIMDRLCYTGGGMTAAKLKALKRKKARSEATATDLKNYAKLVDEANIAEARSWKENEVYDLVDMIHEKPYNYVTGRWMLVVKRKTYGTFDKCKARWVLRGFQDRQKYYQQTDSPTAARPAFRMACQIAANKAWSFEHIDLKTVFLQGETYDFRRDVVCQLPAEAGTESWQGARLLKPAYGMNDAPRKWFNKLDSAIASYGLVPARADRCCYVQYDTPTNTLEPTRNPKSSGYRNIPKPDG